MMTLIKIVHYQVALSEDTMKELKKATKSRSASGALTAAVELALLKKGGKS